MSSAFTTAALLLVAATSPLGLWSCSQSAATPPAPVASGGAGGGVQINVPPPIAIDCDAAVPVENFTPMQSSDALCDPSAPTALFTKDVAPIVGSCTGEVCHASWSYDELVGVHSTFCCDKRFLVDPYLPTDSALIQALLGTNPCVGQMPPGRALTKAEIDPVIAWVCQGASND